MPFRYRLQKILDLRKMKKEEQLIAVVKAQNEVARIENLILKNNQDIATTRQNMRQADFTMLETYDTFLKHLYVKGEELEVQKQEALVKLQEEKDKLMELEKAVNVLEKHKERLKELYIKEQNALELKQLSEIGSQRHFMHKVEEQQEAEMLRQLQAELNPNEVQDED